MKVRETWYRVLDKRKPVSKKEEHEEGEMIARLGTFVSLLLTSRRMTNFLA